MSLFRHTCLKLGRFHPLTWGQEILVPPQEGFRDALSIIHAERAGLLPLLANCIARVAIFVWLN
jgi:hypothetical protein